MWHTSAFGFAVSACSTRTLNGRHTPSRMRSNTVAGSAVSSSSSPASSLDASFARASPSSRVSAAGSGSAMSSFASPNSAATSSFSPAAAWCNHPSMSPTYLLGSLACDSMGRGTPPGPPRVSAVMNRRNSALCRVRLTSSTQYRCSVGRARSAAIARERSSGASSPSSSASARHSACTHRHSRSCAVSWYPAMTSMSARPARWWCVRRSRRQLE